MTLPSIGFEEGERHLDWLRFTEALADGHKRPKAQIADSFLYRDDDTMLNRAAWIDGLGMAVKCANIFPGNRALATPMVNGALMLFSDGTGEPEALIDFHLVTKWKTAADSLLAALRLANPSSEHILIVGAGTVASSLVEAFSAGFPRAKIQIWNRSAKPAETLQNKFPHIERVAKLRPAVERADIVLTATQSTIPVIKGEWLNPGQHVNLIGAFRSDMREADDTALIRSQLFTDSFDTTLAHIGEFQIPLAHKVIERHDIRADFYGLERFPPFSDATITLFKNGGGAHLDLISARHILDLWHHGQT